MDGITRPRYTDRSAYILDVIASPIGSYKYGGGERERDTERERQRKRETERQIERDRQRDIQTDRQYRITKISWTSYHPRSCQPDWGLVLGHLITVAINK